MIQPAPPPPPRRRQVLWAVGGAALAAGVGTAAWLGRRAADTTAAAAAHQALWSLRFSRPEGGELAMSGFAGRPLLINFWATWCPPCIREMPEIDRFARQFAANGWQVLGLAVDQEKPVRDFLSQKPVSYPIALAGFEGIALSRTLGNAAGALPFTVALDRAGRLMHRHLGETRFEQLAAWVTP